MYSRTSQRPPFPSLAIPVLGPLLKIVILCGLPVSALVACVTYARPPADPPTASGGVLSEGNVVVGEASWYGREFHGKRTANGEIYDMNEVSAAHRTWPFGTRVEVTNLENNRSVRLTINDRGPFVGNRILDLSRGAAKRLRMVDTGVARVEARILHLPGQPEFRLQFGAFQNPRYARDLLDRVESHAKEAEIYTEGAWHRVQLRGIEKRRHAKKLEKQLERKGFDVVVVEGAR